AASMVTDWGGRGASRARWTTTPPSHAPRWASSWTISSRHRCSQGNLAHGEHPAQGCGLCRPALLYEERAVHAVHVVVLAEDAEVPGRQIVEGDHHARLGLLDRAGRVLHPTDAAGERVHAEVAHEHHPAALLDLGAFRRVGAPQRAAEHDHRRVL